MRWPGKEGDQLFRGGLEIDLNADISHWNKDINSYANGYRQAADVIILQVLRGKRSYTFNVSYLVFPIVFLYRQYIELRLKEIIQIGSQLYSVKPQGVPRHHRIAELWKHARPFLEKVSAKPDKDLDIIENYVKQFAAVDPESFVFRYPVDLEGKYSISEDLMVIDLKHLGKVMARIGDVLDSYIEGLYVYLDHATEAEGEW